MEARLRAVEDVLEPDGGLVVGPGHALTVVIGGQHGEVADGQVAQVGTGMSRAFQYEKTQSRIGAPPWDAPLQFIENSPIFW